MTGNMITIYLYSRYERLWHWLQGLMIIMLLLTGFEIHEAFPSSDSTWPCAFTTFSD